MKRKDIVIGLGILVLLAGAIYLRQQSSVQEETIVPETLSSEQVFEEKFNIQIPEDVDKAELKDISGGSGSGIATRKFDGGKFTSSVLVDLPDADQGSFYEGWLVRGEEGSDDYSLLSTGKLRLAKGGWMSDFTSSSDLSDHSRVVVSLEKTFDKAPEDKVLEGSF
jgi:hypothetical protein